MSQNAGRTAARTLSFLKREDGSLVIFALCLFLLMAMMGGIAVDLMRYESTRTTLQNTLDRSTLAAAALTQELDSEDVVEDYFDKAGMRSYLKSVTVLEGINFKEVSADALAETNPLFMHLIKVDEFDAPGHSAAEQRITNVEIVLVLDISGSMNSNNRLTNLKVAAKEFVDTVLSSDGEDRISIAIVPFNGQVNLGGVLNTGTLVNNGTPLISKYNATENNEAANVDCVDLPASVYNTDGISRSLALPLTAAADTYSTTNQTTSYVSYGDTNYATVGAANVWCPPSTSNVVRLPGNSISTLQSQIEGLTAIGATSINAGMKWGMTLIDPSSRGMYSELVASGHIGSEFAGRPYEWTDDESMKIVVLMTDGEHFAEERVNTGYKTGASPIYRATSDSNYSIFHASKVVTTNSTTLCNSRPFWVPHLGAWHSRPWNGTTPNSSTCYVPSASFTGYTLLRWPQVWANLRLSYVAWQFYARALGTSSGTRTTIYNDQMAAFRSQTPTSTMDSQLQSVCTAAKGHGVTIYGIAFEAPSGGASQISKCASSPAHYFNASGLQIRTAFRAIASNISQLRLTQ